MPRHSPDALKTLDRSHRQSPSIPSRQSPDRRERTVIDAYHFSKHRKHGTACNGSPTSCSGARASRTSIKNIQLAKDQLPETGPDDGGQAHRSGQDLLQPHPWVWRGSLPRKAMNLPATRPDETGFSAHHDTLCAAILACRSLRTRLPLHLSSEHATRTVKPFGRQTWSLFIR